jgi:hypothetical protein
MPTPFENLTMALKQIEAEHPDGTLRIRADASTFRGDRVVLVLMKKVEGLNSATKPHTQHMYLAREEAEWLIAELTRILKETTDVASPDPRS